MRYPKRLYTAKQKAWCIRYQDETTFEPLMGDYEAGNETFVKAAKKSLLWFEDWSSDAYLRASAGDIPGEAEAWDAAQTPLESSQPSPRPAD